MKPTLAVSPSPAAATRFMGGGYSRMPGTPCRSTVWDPRTTQLPPSVRHGGGGGDISSDVAAVVCNPPCVVSGGITAYLLAPLRYFLADPIRLVGDHCEQQPARPRGAPVSRSARARRTGDLQAFLPPFPAVPPKGGQRPCWALRRTPGVAERSVAIPAVGTQNNGRGRQGTRHGM